MKKKAGARLEGDAGFGRKKTALAGGSVERGALTRWVKCSGQIVAVQQA